MHEMKARNIDGNVTFFGWVEGGSKIEILKRASLFLLPSYGEGMPMCLLEAMGLGLPVVSTKVGGVPRIVKNGINGFVLEPGDAQGIANAIINILDNPSGYPAMSKASKATAASHSLKRYEKRLESLYDEVLGGGR